MTRVVFLGSPQWAVPSLRSLSAAPDSLSMAVVGVVTQPDRPAGRGRLMQPCAVKSAALALGLPVLSPISLRAEEGFRDLAGMSPDLAIVCAYGQILPRRVLDLPALGCWNLHFSLLPRWRGASPVQAAILAGDAETGVSLQRMVEALDAGPVAAKSAPVAIGADETAAELGGRLAELAAQVLRDSLPHLLRGTATVLPQDESQVTVCRKIDKRAGLVDWSRESATEIVRKVRAYTPWPGCASYLGQRGLGLVRVEQAPAGAGSELPVPSAPPGTIAPGGLVRAAHGWVRLLEVKPEGRAVMSFAAFERGNPQAVGTRLAPAPAAD
jgi:methionyl-tRNA formyltransferase